jgi:hypothetical protein
MMVSVQIDSNFGKQCGTQVEGRIMMVYGKAREQAFGLGILLRCRTALMEGGNVVRECEHPTAPHGVSRRMGRYQICTKAAQKAQL